MRRGLPERRGVDDGTGVMRPAAAIAISLALAACSPKAGPPENQATANEKVAAEANVTGNMAGVSVAENVAAPAQKPGKLPPANAALRFVGAWAASPAECKSKPWKFTADALSGSGPHCSFYNVAKAPGGYDIAATCPAKEPVHTDLFKLRFAESAGAMLVESNAIAPTGLIYCGK
jgi:hypothetical protein